jgi:hypothetical protein
MRDVFLLAVHLMVTLVKLTRPGGVRSVIAKSLLLKHQLIIGGRSRRRAPPLTTSDRFLLGLTTMFVHPRRVETIAAILKPACELKILRCNRTRKHQFSLGSGWRGWSLPPQRTLEARHHQLVTLNAKMPSCELPIPDATKLPIGIQYRP